VRPGRPTAGPWCGAQDQQLLDRHVRCAPRAAGGTGVGALDAARPGIAVGTAGGLGRRRVAASPTLTIRAPKRHASRFSTWHRHGSVARGRRRRSPGGLAAYRRGARGEAVPVPCGVAARGRRSSVTRLPRPRNSDLRVPGTVSAGV